MTSEGKQCTIECIDECPNAWQCELFAAGGPDEVNICVPPFLSLCRPCEKNADCAANGVDTGDACLVYGPEGNYCGGNCDQLDCPKGYSCAYAADVAGFKSYQCKATGQCECNAWFADQGAKTACFAKNEWGTCPGERQCDASGLTACSALIPAKETCNGKDDDCDGQTD